MRKLPLFLVTLLLSPFAKADDAALIPVISREELPPGKVRVEILEFAKPAPVVAAKTAPVAAKPDAGTGDLKVSKEKEDGQESTFAKLPELKTEEYEESAFAFASLVGKFDERGVRVDRSKPYLVRAAAVVTLPAGENQLVLRALTGARLAVDGREIAKTEHLRRKGGDAEPVPDQAEKQLIKNMPLLPPGHKESLATIEGDGQPHVITLETFVGGKGLRPEIGELSVSLGTAGGEFRLLTPGKPAAELTDRSWRNFMAEQRERVAAMDTARRRNAGEEAYWKKRHALAREMAKPAPGESIDKLVSAGWEKRGVKPAALSDDASFVRRVYLDTVGLLPTAQEASGFLADTSAGKRAKLIDRLLRDARWADHWTPYWQDVLAENPAMLKATLNNTGPFRWWIHDALLDNKPMDRFATELILMEGSAQYGGPAGFAVSSQNDLPMAAKAQIVSSAFLGMEMKCARCHDAPNHPFNQEDLFSLAAMLQRAPVEVPESSLTKGLSENSHVVVSLKAGQTIEAHYPFADAPKQPLDGVLRKAGDSREMLAAMLTDPRNDRFAQVIVNRLWKAAARLRHRRAGGGLGSSSPSHPELLAWLGRELITHDYDLKHVARLIFNSETYQRVPTAAGTTAAKAEERTFASPRAAG